MAKTKVEKHFCFKCGKDFVKGQLVINMFDEGYLCSDDCMMEFLIETGVKTEVYNGKRNRKAKVETDKE